MATRNKTAATDSPKQKFIEAALEDVREYGVTGLSMRRVAERCGLSSGAAYRHFRDRNELMLEVYRAIKERWEERWRAVVSGTGSARERLIEVSLAYVAFLCEDPAFQTIIMINDTSLTQEQREEKARVTGCTGRLIDEYCAEVGMDDETRQRKVYAVRAFIYGAALMVNSGQMELNEHTLSMVRQCIEREFEDT